MPATLFGLRNARESLLWQITPTLRRTLDMRRSQYWPETRLRAAAAASLARTLAAAARIPFYRSRLGDRPADGDFSSLPLLARSEVAELNRSVRSLYPPGQTFLADRSSGSTGAPAEFLFDASQQESRYAARLRYLVENGWIPGQRTAWITNRTPGDTAPDGMLMRWARVLGAHFLVHNATYRRQAEWLAELDPRALYTFPSNLDGILQAIADGAPRPRRLRRIFCGAEVLDESLRERAREILGVEIAENYGSTEAFIAWQCPSAGMHVNAEHVRVEILDDRGRPAAGGELGRVVVTTLENRLMPLVRYEIGDYAVACSTPCACGRGLPTIGKVAGRAVNLFRRPNGERFSPWTLVGPIRRVTEFRQFQLVQQALDHLVVRYVSDEEVAEDRLATARRELLERLGFSARIDFHRRESIPRAASGKFMTALSAI